ncbi:MAG: hypothetical protein JSS29_19720 [Proteobacteria bacterium]|nr:hypothetical protein [Pseudomonadota bacterium]
MELKESSIRQIPLSIREHRGDREKNNMQMKHQSLTRGALVIVMLAASISAAAQQFSVRRIPSIDSLPGSGAPQGAAINANGDVTGTVFPFPPSSVQPHVFLYSYSNNITTDLTDGNCTAVTSGASGVAISAKGTIAATLCVTTGTPTPAVYESGAFTSIGVGPNALGGTAAAINTKGEVVGTLELPGTAQCGSNLHAFSYSSITGRTTDLSKALKTIGCSSQATAVNDAGEVVGYVYDASTEPRAFRYLSGSATDIGGLPCGTVTALPALATGINATGQITGYSFGCPSGHEAFVYSNGSMRDVGNFGGASGSEGHAINSSGQVTGASFLPSDAAEHAFLFSDASLLDLNNLIASGDAALYTLVDGIAIDDAGKILVQGYVNSDPATPVSFVLTPTSPRMLTVAPLSVVVDGDGNYAVTLNVTNSGEAPSVGASLTGAAIVLRKTSTNTTTALPSAIGSLAPGESLALMVTFPTSVGSSGAVTKLKWAVKDSGGVTRGTSVVTLP